MSKKRPLLTLTNDLNMYKVLKTKIKMLELELSRIQREYVGITSNSDGLPSGGINKNVENEVLLKTKKEEKLLKEIQELKQAVNKIDVSLSALTDIEKRVIEEKYFNNYDFYMISDMIGYAYSTVKLYHSKAINKLLAIY